MTTITLSEETVKMAYDILVEGQMTTKEEKKCKPFNDCFESSETVTAKHILWEDFVSATGCQIPKVFGYIVMDKLWGLCTGKDEKGFAGYHRKFVSC